MPALFQNKTSSQSMVLSHEQMTIKLLFSVALNVGAAKPKQDLVMINGAFMNMASGHIVQTEHCEWTRLV